MDIIRHFYCILRCSYNWRRSASILGVLICCCVLCSCTKDLIVSDQSDVPETAVLSVLKKHNLKVLDIGNSYSEGATALLPQIVEEIDADVSDMCLYWITRGGGSFKSWCEVYQDSDTHQYFFHRVVGGASISVAPGLGDSGDGSLFRRVLSDVEWDIIIIHQLSSFAPYYEFWNDDSSAGGYLDLLIDIIKSNQPHAMIGFMIVHSYWDGYSGNKEKSSFIRWQKIAESVQRLQEDNSEIQFIIPYGTAVENLRMSSLNNEFDLTSDGSHCGYGLCQYTAACCYYETLLAPRTGVSCYGHNAQIDVSKKTTVYPSVDVTPENARIAQKAAILAANDMFNCSNPEE